MAETCFVVMPISTQGVGEPSITTEALKDRYEYVIKAALLAARPSLDVTRADACAMSGTFTNDMLAHLTQDTFVVVDITFPNPNVYYELGVRSASRPGTILIRDKDATADVPIDISHERHIEYDTQPGADSRLAAQFESYFASYDQDKERPDNQLLQFAKATQFNFPQYRDRIVYFRSPQDETYNGPFYEYLSRQISKAKDDVYITGDGLDLRDSRTAKVADQYVEAYRHAMENGVRVTRLEKVDHFKEGWREMLEGLVREFPTKFRLYALKQKENVQITSFCVIDPVRERDCVVEVMFPMDRPSGDRKESIAGPVLFIHNDPALAKSFAEELLKIVGNADICRLYSNPEEIVQRE